MSKIWQTTRIIQPDDTKIGAHRWKKVKCFPWPYCTNCGMIILNNDVCQKKAKKACYS